MAQQPRQESLKPVVGTYTVPKDRRAKISASAAFDVAWERALVKAADAWGPTAQVRVDVSYRARIDVWNPGGIGMCSVVLTPRGD
jgi:hypothetical protein